MNSLPDDILRLNFSLLATRDKLECMTVCRQWHDIILDHNLFRIIGINRHQQLAQLIDRVRTNPMLGSKVKRLKINIDLEPDFDANIFVTLFPKLHDVFIIKTSSSNTESITPHQNHPWCKHIENLEEIGSSVLTKTLLLSGLCNRLTFISVTENHFKPVRSFIELLTNAPGLKTLHLCRYLASFDDLELLHKNVPQLHSLLLEYIWFDNNHFPLDIMPANSIKIFHCVMCNFDSFSNLNPHLWYIYRKYPRVNKLEINIDPLSIEDTNEINSMEHQRGVITSYMKTLGLQLKHLSLYMYNISGIYHPAAFDFDILDECGCQMENVTLRPFVDLTTMERLANSTQSQCIQSLTIGRLYYERSDLSLFNLLKKFTALKELALEFNVSGRLSSKLTLDLAHLMEIPLNTLRLTDVHLKFTDSGKLPGYLSLKDLTLSRVSCHTGTDVRISQAFLNLKRVTLDGCLSGGDSFRLPTTDLLYFKLIRRNIKTSSPIQVMTLNDNQTRLYHTSVVQSFRDIAIDDVFILPSVSCQLLNPSETIPVVTVLCRSLYHFFMVNDTTARLNL